MKKKEGVLVPAKAIKRYISKKKKKEIPHAMREFFSDNGFYDPQKAQISRRGMRIVRKYAEAVIKDNSPNPRALRAAFAHPDYDEEVGLLLNGINHWLAYPSSPPPTKSPGENKSFQIEEEILNYLQLVRETYEGEITHSQILEEVAFGLEGVRRAQSIILRPEKERTRLAKKDIDKSKEERERLALKRMFKKTPGVKITLEKIVETVQRDLGYSLVNDYLIFADNFNASIYATERGFSSLSEMLKTLTLFQREEYKQTVWKVYETKVRAGEKVNLAEFCRKSGVSTSMMYRMVKEKDGSMEQFRERIKTKKEKERITEEPETYNFERQVAPKENDSLRRVAAAAAAAITLFTPNSTNRVNYVRPIEPPRIIAYSQQDSPENYMTLAEADAFLKPNTLEKK